MKKKIFIELTVTESGLLNVTSPRRVLVDAMDIASVEDLGDDPHGRCYVTLYEPADAAVEGDSGESVARGRKTLTVLDYYEDIRKGLDLIGATTRSNESVR